MKGKKIMLKEWYETGEVGDGEEVVTSNMPDSFQQMRNQRDEPQSLEIELEKKAPEDEQYKKDKEHTNEPETLEGKAVKDVYIKMGVFYDTLNSYREGFERGDEPMQMEFLKERLKNISVEVMRLVDGI